MLFTEEQVIDIVKHFTKKSNIQKEKIEKYIDDNYKNKVGCYLSLINKETEKDIKLPFVYENLCDVNYILSLYTSIILNQPPEEYVGYLINELIVNGNSYYLEDFDGTNFTFCCSDDPDKIIITGYYDTNLITRM